MVRGIIYSKGEKRKKNRSEKIIINFIYVEFVITMRDPSRNIQ